MENKEEIWNLIQLNLNKYEELGPQCGAFLKALKPESFSEYKLVLSSQSNPILIRVRKDYLTYIEAALLELTGKEYKVELILAAADTSYQEADYITYETAAAPQPSITYQNQQPNTSYSPNLEFNNVLTPTLITENPHDSSKTFENFVVDESNNFAYSVARSIAEQPNGKNLPNNPFFLYGKSGLGKTHLLLAIKNFISYNFPHLRVVYVPTIIFVNHYTNAIRTNEWEDFTNTYRNCDVLLLDDIQNLEKKEGCTNEIFTIFNNMISQNKRILFSADRPPKSIELDERFTSRFASGIIVDIQPPTFETKLIIFKNFVKNQCSFNGINNFYVPEEIYTRIVEISNSNIRLLEGVAMKLAAIIKTRGTDSPITIEEAEEMAETVYSRNTRKNITISAIQKEVENYYHISHADMIGNKRSHNISQPRQIAMYLSRLLTSDISYPEIARAFGGKNHSSVIYACNMIEEKRVNDFQIKSDIEHLVGILED